MTCVRQMASKSHHLNLSGPSTAFQSLQNSKNAQDGSPRGLVLPPGKRGYICGGGTISVTVLRRDASRALLGMGQSGISCLFGVKNNGKFIFGVPMDEALSHNAEGSHFSDASGTPCPGTEGNVLSTQMPAGSPGVSGSCTLPQRLGLAGAQD